MGETSASWSALFHRRRAAYTVLLSLAVGVHAVGIHLRGTIMPSVIDELGGAAYYTWALMLYTVASIMATACGGRLQTTLGIRRGYIIGCVVVMAGALFCAAAPHIMVFLLANAIQGIGGGLLLALGYGMVGTLYPDVLRPRVLSAVSGLWGIAAFLGPTVGGLFAGAGWWRGAFWIAVPALALLVALAFYALPPQAATPSARRLPGLRLTLLAIGVLAIAASGQTAGLGVRLALVGIACALTAMTFYLDAYAADRLFPSQALSLATPVGMTAWMFILFGVTTSQITVFMPLIGQTIYGISPLGAGYFTATLSFAWTVLALCSAGWRERRAQLAILWGPFVVTCGVMGMAARVGSGSLWQLGVFLALAGAGIGVCFAHVSSWAIGSARATEEALTAASIPLQQSLGIAFGAAISGLVANAAGLASGVSPATVSAAATWVYGLCALAPLLILLLALRLWWLHGETRVAATTSSS